MGKSDPPFVNWKKIDFFFLAEINPIFFLANFSSQITLLINEQHTHSQNHDQG